MDNFGTINGIPKRYWGDREPSDKKVIWYKNNIPHSYQDGEWKPLTGGSSATGLGALKDFIDKTTPDWYEIPDDAIVGVRINANSYEAEDGRSFLGVENLFSNIYGLSPLAAFNETTGLFEPISKISNSGGLHVINTLMFNGYENSTGIKQTSTEDKSRVILMEYKNIWSWLSTDITDETIYIKRLGTIVYYKDLK